MISMRSREDRADLGGSISMGKSTIFSVTRGKTLSSSDNSRVTWSRPAMFQGETLRIAVVVRRGRWRWNNRLAPARRSLSCYRRT
jgi:hypothetical protein